MATDIVMPRLSDSMEEGTILTWMKEVGDEVAVGEELVEIETDKANMVYESDTAGTLIEILASENDTLPIGQPIARVGEPGEAPSGDGAQAQEPRKAEEEKEEEAESEPETQAPTATETVEAPAEPSGDGRVKASPIARRIANEKGLDLATLQGSGPGGRIIKADVEKAVAAGPVAPAAPPAEAPAPAAAPAAPTPGARERPETAKGETQVVELTKLQQTVARRMAESKATAPHFYLSMEVDMSRCVEARTRIKAASGEGEVVPSFNDMVVKGTALALREFPRANGSYRDGKWELHSRVNVGIAVAAQDALVVPTIFDTDIKGLRQIATEARALAQRVRDQTITPPELSGGTFAVSNLGMYGISNFQAVINPPHAGILAVGTITETPVVRDGEITTAHLMGVTLACDHRILYGADGADFLGRIRALLEEPLGLAL
ncbi:MAG TPA: dihydrolipoamide acetyltransferase family protein [Solirubrobacterales bacterium]|jgi:pyruvate dehydrogenase E2 component (dihydrolipoamide acetyltransferase)|nr:dihydrolipoamide acetyltransferase family protein [Solirubrobacterales bacterium]